MIVIPAVDIREGRCVRLTQGNFSREEVFSNSAFEMAKRWEDEGAELIHLVDLDGARIGKMQNLQVILKIIQEVGVPVQVGGGVRDFETAEKLLKAGAERVVLGTSAVRNINLARELSGEFGPEAVCISVDARNNRVAVEGWCRFAEISPEELATNAGKAGAGYVLFTFIERDGMLSGINFRMLERMTRRIELPVIASGGAASLMDVEAARRMGIWGIVIGKALYRGRINFKEAVRCSRGE